MRLALPEGTSEAVDSTQYRAYQTVAEQFGAGQNGPLLVVAQTPDAVAEADQLRAQVEVAAVLAEQSDVVAVAPVGVSDDGTVFAFQVIPHDGPASERVDRAARAHAAGSVAEARLVVRDYCDSLGVPYTETSLWRSYAIVIDYLNRVGLAARDPFDCPMVSQYRRA